MTREYRGYKIKKNYITNDYEIMEGTKYLYYNRAKTSFSRLKDAKVFVDRWLDTELKNSTHYTFGIN